jgi:hypothetical protein
MSLIHLGMMILPPLLCVMSQRLALYCIIMASLSHPDTDMLYRLPYHRRVALIPSRRCRILPLPGCDQRHACKRALKNLSGRRHVSGTLCYVLSLSAEYRSTGRSCMLHRCQPVPGWIPRSSLSLWHTLTRSPTASDGIAISDHRRAVDIMTSRCRDRHAKCHLAVIDAWP